MRQVGASAIATLAATRAWSDSLPNFNRKLRQLQQGLPQLKAPLGYDSKQNSTVLR
jgi:hypothetical protein